MAIFETPRQRNTVLFILALTFLLLGPMMCKCWGSTTYYLDCTGGNDSADGKSEANAWLTMAHAVTIMDANDDVLDMNNVTWEQWSAVWPTDCNFYTMDCNMYSSYNTVGVRFDDYTQCAKYTSNHDPWFISDCNIIATYPPCVDSGGDLHGAMWNPIGNESYQGYDETNSYFGYSAEKNIADEIDISATPLNISTNGSFIKARCKTGAGGEPSLTSSTILSQAVFTFSSTKPNEGDFRPGYCGDNKVSYLNISDVNYDMLADVVATKSSLAISTAGSYVGFPFVDHGLHTACRGIHSYSACFYDGVYAGYMAYIIRDHYAPVMLAINQNYTDSEKSPAVKGLIQIAIDLMSVLENGGSSNWESNGGHSSGRLPIICAAATLTRDPNMLNVQNHGYQFGDIGQHFYVSLNDIYTFPYAQYYDNGAYYWGHYRSSSPEEEETDYTSVHLNLAEYGTNHDGDRNGDSLDWAALYRGVNGPGDTSLALALRMIGYSGDEEDPNWAVNIFNYGSYFDYADRYFAVSDVYGDPPPAFADEMWDAYRTNYGSVYTGYVGIDITYPSVLSDVSDVQAINSVQISFSGQEAGAKCYYVIKEVDVNNYVNWSTLTTQGYDSFTGSGNSFVQADVQDYGYIDLTSNPLGDGLGVMFSVYMNVSGHSTYSYPLILSNAVGSANSLLSGNGLFIAAAKPSAAYQFGIVATLKEGGVTIASDSYLEGAVITPAWWVYVIKDGNDFIITIRDTIQLGVILDTFTLTESAGIGPITKLYFWNTPAANGSNVVNQNIDLRYYCYNHDYTKLIGYSSSSSSPLTITNGISGGYYYYWMWNVDSSDIVSDDVVSGYFSFPEYQAISGKYFLIRK